jgi:hypothetical protein
MTSLRRQNGSIVGSSVIPVTTGPSVAYGVWDKNEQYSLIGANLWPTGKYSFMTITYNFTSNNSTVSFNGVTIAGNAGTSSNTSESGSGGTYTITNNNGLCGGTNGGAGGAGRVLLSFFTGSGAGGGAAGGGVGGNYTSGSGAPFSDISGFLAAYAAAGYTAGANFGKGGNGSTSVGNNGNVPGAGGGGAGNPSSGYTAGGTGAAAMILITYTQYSSVIYQLVNQASGAGSITLPQGTSYVKAWAIGNGGGGGEGDMDLTNNIYRVGGGGGGGGFAYGEFN